MLVCLHPCSSGEHRLTMEADQVGGFVHLFIYFSAVSLSLPWSSSTWSIVRGTEIQAMGKESSLSRKGPFQPLFSKKLSTLEISPSSPS